MNWSFFFFAWALWPVVFDEKSSLRRVGTATYPFGKSSPIVSRFWILFTYDANSSKTHKHISATALFSQYLTHTTRINKNAFSSKRCIRFWDRCQNEIVQPWSRNTIIRQPESNQSIIKLSYLFIFAHYLRSVALYGGITTSKKTEVSLA